MQRIPYIKYGTYDYELNLKDFTEVFDKHGLFDKYNRYWECDCGAGGIYYYGEIRNEYKNIICSGPGNNLSLINGKRFSTIEELDLYFERKKGI